MAIPIYRMHNISRGGSSQSAVGYAAYGSGEALQGTSSEGKSVKGKSLKVQSMVAAASYRSGEPLHDRHHDKLWDYTERDDVMHTEILAPDHAPEWCLDRETLWNAVEAKENRSNSRLARTIVIALPRELDMEANIALLREHVLETFVSEGMIADIAIHDKDASDGGRNPHAHVLLTVREVEESGEWAKNKNRSWDGWETKEDREAREAEGLPSLLEQWREAWEQTQNRYLEEADSDARVSMESYQARGINRVSQIHQGIRATKIEGRDGDSFIVEKNRNTKQENHARAWVDAYMPPSNDVLPDGMLWGDVLRAKADKEWQDAIEAEATIQQLEQENDYQVER